MKRTTILADEALLVEVKHLAEQEGRTLTAIVQEALRAYVRTHQPPRRLSVAGAGRSGQPQLARQEQVTLSDEITPLEGWSPKRANSAARAAAAGERRHPKT